MSISLTAGMRSNLYSLQNTAQMMDQTQTRLSSGKKVNSALDNPSSYFTAKGHMERASGLAAYKDGMGEAVQAINAANAGITGITSLIDSAIAVAKDAKELDASAGNATQTITLDDVEDGDIVTIGGYQYTAATGDASSGTSFGIGGSDSIAAANLAMLINSNAETQEIDATSVNGATISLARGSGDMEAGDVVVNTDNEARITESVLTAGGGDSADERANLVAQYAQLMAQLDDLVADSNYKGTNLLDTVSDEANQLVVDFTDDHSITLGGFDARANLGLGLEVTATDGWASKANAETDIGKLEAAKDKLEMEASDLASNLSTIKARQAFSTSMINTLETGADNLTLADMNEEGANMLMLQTQQSLAVTSLSMSAQSAQSVLRLF